MYLMNLIYASKKSNHWNESDINLILHSSSKNNSQNGITGALCFNGDYFLQCLEGGRMAVNQLYKKILDDPRHEDVLLLRYEEVSHRSFGDWSMVYVPTTKFAEPSVMKYSTSANFDPFLMSGDSAYELCLELVYGLSADS
jgi:hypothetical protein